MSIVAYLDPGTGGLIASAAAAGFAGVAVVAKSKWRSASGKLRKKDDASSSGPDGTGSA